MVNVHYERYVVAETASDPFVKRSHLDCDIREPSAGQKAVVDVIAPTIARPRLPVQGRIRFGPELDGSGLVVGADEIKRCCGLDDVGEVRTALTDVPKDVVVEIAGHDRRPIVEELAVQRERRFHLTPTRGQRMLLRCAMVLAPGREHSRSP